MDLKRWKVFQSLDPVFLSHVKWAFVGRPKGVIHGENGTRKHGRHFIDEIEVGFLVMRNDDVFGVTGEEGGFEFLGVKADADELPSSESLSRTMDKSAKCFMPMKIVELCGKKVKEFGHTRGLVVALTDDGHVYQWGKGQPDVPTLVGGDLIGDEVCQVATGSHHVLALTRSDQIYFWSEGKGASEVINGEPSEIPAPKPIKISTVGFSEWEIRSVACSASAVFILTEEGRVRWWGANEVGSEPSGGAKVIDPRVIEDLSNVAKIAAGSQELLTLTKDNELFMWGLDQSEENQEGRNFTVRKLDLGSELPTDIAASASIFACRTRSKKIYVWGRWCGQDVTKPMEAYLASLEQVFAAEIIRPFTSGVMKRQLYKGKRVTDAWEEAFNDAETADIKFKIEERYLAGHTLFLKFRSQYFRDFLSSGDWKTSDACVDINYFNYETFRTFLYYLYTDQIDCEYTLNNFKALLKIAVDYKEDDLRERCEDLMKIFINQWNVCSLYSLAVECDAEKLKLHAIEYMILNFSSVEATPGFEDLSRELKTALMRDMNDRGVFQDLLFKLGD